MYNIGGAIWYIMSPRYNIQHIMECGLCKCVKCCLVLTLYWIPAAPGGTILVEQYDTGIYTITYWIWYIMDCLLNVMILTLHWIPVAPGGNPCNPRNQNKWVLKIEKRGKLGDLTADYVEGMP